MDLDLIKQEIENDCFEFEKTVNFILDMLSRICAPVRDEEIANLKKTEGVINILKYLRLIFFRIKVIILHFF